MERAGAVKVVVAKVVVPKEAQEKVEVSAEEAAVAKEVADL